MKENNTDAKQSVDADAGIELDAQTLRRLESVRTPNESCDDTLNRILDGAINEVSLEKMVTDLLDQFPNAVSIAVVSMPTIQDPQRITISVHTGEAGLEEDVNLYDGVESRVVIESQTGGEFSIPFDVYATCDGPKFETINTTTVYQTNDVMRSEEITVEEGLDRVGEKIGKPREEVRNLVSPQ